MIFVNMTKAIEIKKDMIRAERAPLMAALDVDFMQAIETGNTKAQAEIAKKKQALRDATKDPAIAAAKTPEKLKAVIPSAFK